MKFWKKEEWKFFYPLYVGLGVGITIPDIDMLVMVYFLSHGFSATDIGIGLALQSLFLLLSEVPTGAFADLFGKRRSVQVSWLMQSAIFAVFFFVSDKWWMWLLFALKGIAYTFSTGAFEALPYEIAKKEKKEYLINQFYSTYEFIYQFATGLSNLNVILFLFLVGATQTYILFGQTHKGLDFLWLTGAVGYFAGALILSRLKENVARRSVNLKADAKKTYALMLNAFKYTNAHPVVRKVVIVGIFAQVSTMLFSDIVYQPFLMGMGIRIENIAVLVGIASISAAVFSLIPKYLIHKFDGEKKYLEAMMLVKILVLLSIFFINSPVFGIAFFLVYFGFDALTSPVLSPFKQFFYREDMRATLGSVESVIKNIASVIFYPVIGIIIDNFGVKTAIMFSLIPLVFEYLIFRTIKHQAKLDHSQSR